MSRTRLVIGDLLSLAVLTLIGFATHGETDISFLPRMTTTFFPLVVGWFALSPALGLFDAQCTGSTRQLWRPALSGFFAAQLAVILRALLLGSVALPIFALVLGGSAGLGMAVWRGLALWLFDRGK